MQKTIETSAGEAVTGSSARSESPVSPPAMESSDARERVRELLQAEVDKQGALDEARRAAVLIGESSIRFSGDSETDFVIVGPDGQPRMSAQDGRSIPFSLKDLAAELRRNYPALFRPDAPDATAPSPEPVKPPPRDWLMVGSGEPASPIESGASIDGGGDHPEANGNATAEAPGVQHPASEVVEKTEQRDDRVSNVAPMTDMVPIGHEFRPSYAIYGAVALVLGVILAALIAWPDSEPSPSSAPGQQGKVGSTGPAATAAPTPSQANAKLPPAALSGVPEVVDTSTLRIDGRVVRLFGVEWERGAQADNLTRYIAGREVVCTPAVRPDRHRCRIEGRDLSEVVLYNGGGRATSEATPELKAAEAKAKAAGFGIWQKP